MTTGTHDMTSGWKFDKTVNLPLIVTIVLGLITISVDSGRRDERDKNLEQRMSGIEKALDKLAEYSRSVNQLEVQVQRNKDDIKALREEVQDAR